MICLEYENSDRGSSMGSWDSSMSEGGKGRHLWGAVVAEDK